MSFHDVSVPSDFQYGSEFGAGFGTVAQETASGHEYRIARQATPKHKFRLRKTLQSQAELAALKAFVMARRGALHSFRLKDWADYTTNENGTGATTNLDCILGTGDASQQSFQLLKTYSEGDPGELDRTITLPVDGTLKVAVAAASQTEGVDYTVTNPGGVITFAGGSTPGIGEVVTAGFEFDVPARFSLTVDEWNALRADAFEVWSLADLGCVEVLNEVEYPELWYPGGGTEWGEITSDITLSLAQGKLHTMENTTGGTLNAFLPAPPTLFPGGDLIFVITNVTGAASSVQVRDDAGNVVGSALAANETLLIGATVASGTVTWVAY